MDRPPANSVTCAKAHAGEMRLEQATAVNKGGQRLLCAPLAKTPFTAERVAAHLQCVRPFRPTIERNAKYGNADSHRVGATIRTSASRWD